MSHFAGLNGGGSVTECVVIDHEGKDAGGGRGGPSNTNFVTLEEAYENVVNVVSEAFRNVARCRRAGVAVAGSFSREAGSRGSALEELYRRSESVEYYTEHQAALASCGIFVDDGVAVVAGTGSSVVAYRNNKEAIVGGWGSALGDEGSAYDIAINAVRAAVRSHDGHGPKSQPLEDLVGRHFGLADIRDLVSVFYRTGVRRDKVADFCRVLAEQGQDDPVIAERFSMAGRELSLIAATGARRLYRPEDPVHVAMSGGVWKAGGILRRIFEECFRIAFPLSVFHDQIMTPARGLAVRVQREHA